MLIALFTTQIDSLIPNKLAKAAQAQIFQKIPAKPRSIAF